MSHILLRPVMVVSSLWSDLLQAFGYGAPFVADDGVTILDQRQSGTFFARQIGDARLPQPGRAYEFDGVDDYIPIQQISTESQMGVSGWVKLPDSSGTNRNIINCGTSLTNRWAIGVTNNSVYATFRQGATAYTNRATLTTPGEWCHFVVVYDVDDVKVYINGVDRTSISGGPSFSDSFTAIGATGVGSNLFDGQMFDLRVYDKALTQDEINHVYTFGELGTDPATDNLVAQYKCDDTDPVTAYDSSGNDNHGTKTNITPATFHYESEDVPYSFQNEVGFSNCATFDGVNDSIPTSIAEPAFPYSLAFRIKVDDASRDQNVFGLDLNGVMILSSKIIFYRSAQVYRYANVNLIDGEWANVVLVVSSLASTSTDIYINGGLSSGSASGGENDGPIIGEYAISHALNGRALEGSLRDVRIYDGALTADDALSLSQGVDPTGVDLLHHYPLSEGEGTLVADIAGGNDATAVNTGSDFWTTIPRDESDPAFDVAGIDLQYAGRVPRNGLLVNSHCATFDGVDDHVALDSDITLTGDFEIEMWINATLGGIDTFILSGGAGTNGFEIYDTNSAVTIYYEGGVVAPIATKTLRGGWKRFKVVRVGTTVTGYIDGGSSASTTLSGTCKITVIGRRDGGAFYWDGSMCDLRITDAGTLVNHYPLSEGAGSTAYDVVGGNHGTITNATEASFWGQTQDLYHHNILEGFEDVYELSQTDATNYFKRYTAAFRQLFANNDQTSIEIEFYNAGQPANQYFVDTGFLNPVAIQLAASGAAGIFYRTTGGASASFNTAGVLEFEVGQWHAIKVEFDKGASEIRIFKNGVLGFTHSDPIDPTTTSAANIALGNYQTGTSPFNGHIKSMRFLISEVVAHEYLAKNDYADSVGTQHLTLTGTVSKIKHPIEPNSGFTNPAVSGHNNAEAQIDFTGGEPDQPWLDKLWKGWAEFDGAASYVQLPTTIGTPISYKISGTFNSSAGATQAIVDCRDSFSDGFKIDLVSSGEVRSIHNGTVTSTVSTYDDSTDHTFTLEWDGATVTLTVDAETVSASIGTAINVAGTATIGKVAYSADQYFNGNLSDLTIELDGVETYNLPLVKNTLDYSGNNNHGTNNGVTFAVGNMEASPSGYALFDGVGLTEINLDSDLVLSGDFTYFVRLRYTTALDTILIGNNGANTDFIYNSSATATVVKGNSVVESITHGHTFVLGEDCSFAVKREGTTITIYKDGQPGATTGTQSETITLGTLGSFFIGTSGQYFEGRMHDVQVFDGTALTDKQIANLHNGQDVGSPTLNLPLFEDANDISGSGNNGTVQGGVTFPEDYLGPAYSFGDGRVAPNYVDHVSDVKENKFRTEKL